MKIVDMDNQARLKLFWWRINPIDLMVLVLVLCVLPLPYFTYKVLTKKGGPPPKIYTISKTCPVCKRPIELQIPTGELPEDSYTRMCSICGNEVELVIRIPTEPPPPPILSYGEQYYKRMLERMDREENAFIYDKFP